MTQLSSIPRRVRARYLRSTVHRGLMRGSEGGEQISAATLFAWGLGILHTPIRNALSHVARLAVAFHPAFAALMVLVGGLHLVLLFVIPDQLRTVRLRKVLSLLSLLFWLEVVQSLVVVGTRAYGFALLMTCVLLVYASARKAY